jgi:hypothetical protein
VRKFKKKKSRVVCLIFGTEDYITAAAEAASLHDSKQGNASGSFPLKTAAVTPEVGYLHLYTLHEMSLGRRARASAADIYFVWRPKEGFVA